MCFRRQETGRILLGPCVRGVSTVTQSERLTCLSRTFGLCTHRLLLSTGNGVRRDASTLKQPKGLLFMADIRNQQQVPEENSPEYQQGWHEAMQEASRDLATTLRLHSRINDPSDAEGLTDQKMREIFTGAFNAQEALREFGPEPKGFFDKGKLPPYMDGSVD